MALLELRGVGKRFGGLPAVDDVTFDVDRGEIVALVGPNGAGKSTLLKAIGGMHAPTSGEITFDGKHLGSGRAHRARHHGVAMVLQTPQPFHSMTVIENCMVGAMFGGTAMNESTARDKAHEALDFVGLDKHADEDVSSLNLHEQRFLEIARQMVGEPQLILLDEVMAGLNDTELDSSIEMVRKLRDERHVTVLWVEHVMKAVMTLAERVLVLNFGKLIADGKPRQVMTEPEVVTAYLGDRGLRHEVAEESTSKDDSSSKDASASKDAP